MKYAMFLVVLLSLTFSKVSSQQNFRFDDYFYFRNNIYLQTPNALLNGAVLKMGSRDTAAAIELVKQAASKGMFDTLYITTKSKLKFITTTPHWKQIATTIQNNRDKYADPAAMEIRTEDIDNFWRLFDRIHDKNSDELFTSEYIVKGSPGIRTFYEVRMQSRATNLLESVRQRQKYYESIRPITLQVKNYKPAIKEAARKIKELYPDAIFPPTTFIVAHLNSFGTADGGGGQLISTEFFLNPSQLDTAGIGEWERSVLTDTSKLLGIVVHENIHIQEKSKWDPSLLGRCTVEGLCDFITQLVLGYNINSRIHDYGNRHEKELWEKFSKQMHGKDVDEWLYNGMSAKDYPADLGYYIGYKICEAYYDKAVDKKQAVKDILEIQDFKKFLADSGYEEKIAKMASNP
ncbi:DUF2268 domain-containing putative Zn-dependent protease [Aridibaculum aurantiacum]|uniref:gliding motility protein GldB-related protein n=1 Tax=Aridibaculum aurantiacum TaxID=2810307 RepID=UPI001A972B31|nr:DUF2268 domain-containing putative Zn-dependent protease [Aridibaculum aurantiacum]